MKIKHVITFDRGTGPVTLVELGEDPVRMFRIVHNARFDRFKEVDLEQTRSHLASVEDIGQASTKLDKENSAIVSQEVLRWINSNGVASQAMRWTDQGEGVLFRNEEDAIAWEILNIEPEQTVTKRRRIMG